MVIHVKAALGFGLVAVLAGCAGQTEPPPPPKFFTVNYTVTRADADAALITKFLRNELTINESRLLSPLQLDLCNFTMSFDESDTTVQAPQLRFSGAPSTSGFSVTVTDLRPRNLATTNDPNCPEVTAVSMTMGGNTSIALNQPIDITSSSISMGGREYKSDVSGSTQTFVFRSYNSSNLYTTGALRLKLKYNRQINTALYVDGTFALR